MTFPLLSLFSYFLGNISGALLIGKLFYKTDIREYGSGNAGMTNAIRVFGKKVGIIPFIIDFIKGLIAAGIGFYLAGELGVMIAGISVVLGHVWPILFNFKGGKGIATSFGVLMAVTPLHVLLMFVVFIIVVIITKYVSLGSVLAAMTGLIMGAQFLLTGRVYLSALYLVLALVSLFKHRYNMVRLMTGEENKIK